MKTKYLKLFRSTAAALLLSNVCHLASAQTPVRGVGGNAVNLGVYAIALDASGNVYVGGNFSVAGNISANNIAMWNPTTRIWSSLANANGNGVSSPGSGSSPAAVNAILVAPDGKVYVGGSFASVASGTITARNVAVWNPANHTWSALNVGVTSGTAPDSSYVRALYMDSTSKLWVGGSFNFAGSPQVNARNLARWTGSAWQAVGTPIAHNSSVYPVNKMRGTGGNPLVASGGNVYTLSGSSTWVPKTSTDLNGPFIYDLLLSGVGVPDFCVGGGFAPPNGGSGIAQHIVTPSSYAAFPGAPASTGPAFAGTVNALEYFGDYLVIGGSLGLAAGPHGYLARGVAKYAPGQGWSTLDVDDPNNGVSGGDGGKVYALTATNSTPPKLYVGGSFTQAGNNCASCIAVWNGITWSALANNVAPTVAITTPLNNTPFTRPASVTINATASDDCSVSKVEFFDGSSPIGSPVLSPPYSTVWNPVSLGSHALTAKVTDNDGATFTCAAVNVTVLNAQPTVSITSPANNTPLTRPVNVTVSATASDGDGSVAKVEFFDGGSPIGSPVTSPPYSRVWNPVSLGSHALTAKVTDNDGATFTCAAVNVTVLNAQPTVSITSPQDGAVVVSPASVTINATAADPDGVVNSVVFYDGAAPIGPGTLSGSQWTFVWSQPSVGAHSITAVATDNNGAATTSSPAVGITVNPPVCTTPVSGLISWWRAEGNATDSADGNDGSTSGGVNYVAGEVGQAFDFDGNYSGVDLGNPVNLQLQTFTIEAWVKRHSATQATLDTAHPDNGSFLCYADGGYLFGPANDGRLILGRVGVSAVYSSALVLTDTENYHHVAVTTTGGNVVFYLDGVAESVGAYDPGYTFDGPVAIAGRGGDLAASFYGSIDELSIYDHALSAEEISAIHDASSAGKCPLPPPVCTTPVSGLISWWRAEGAATDSADGNDGSTSGGVNYVAGEVGQAFDFDGNYSGVDLGNPANLQLQTFTIEAWVKRHSATQATLDTAHPDNGSFLCYADGGYLFGPANDGRLILGRVGVSAVYSSALVLTDTENYHHVAVTTTGGNVVFYLDGVAESVGAYDPGYTFDGPVAIAGRGGDLAASFYGSIDELSIYDHALSAEEISAIYHAKSAGKCSLDQTWTPTDSLAAQRFWHAAASLSDGKVLVVGGDDLGTSVRVTESYDPTTGAWTTAGLLNVGRYWHTANLLPNGKVLAVGGTANGGTALFSVELFDPATRTWSAGNSLSVARYLHTATSLANGNVLVAAGANGSGYLTSASVYDANTGTWTPTGSLNVGRIDHTSTLLSNAKVLVAGGNGSGGSLASAELYNPATGTWTPTGPLTTARNWHTAVKLSDGKVLVSGGMGSGSVTLSSAELYDPATGLWTPTGSMVSARKYHTATLLPNGKVLVVGGSGGPGSAELYDPSTGTWTATGSPTTGRFFHTATSLPNGRVLVAGGTFNGSAGLVEAEVYHP